MDRLTDKEVEHVARLARLELSDEEKEVYAFKLKEIMNSIDKIKDVKEENDDILITPTDNICVMTKDVAGEELSINDVLKNAPRVHDTYVEVRGTVND